MVFGNESDIIDALDVQPMPRVLVMSDNAPLCGWLQREFESQAVRDFAEVEWAYSTSNRNPFPMEDLGATALDLSDYVTILSVVRRFDVILNVHGKQIFPPELVDHVTCINVHPGFNPYNRGWYPQVFSIINGLPVGATIHIMDAEIDHGPIIAQETVQVDPGDTSLEVYEKILNLEKRLVAEHLVQILTLTFSAKAPQCEGNINTLADFYALGEIDLDGVGTMREHLALIRALSHGRCRNAFFVANKKKHFIRVMIDSEDDLKPHTGESSADNVVAAHD